jgi:hypothetical protein
MIVLPCTVADPQNDARFHTHSARRRSVNNHRETKKKRRG